MSKSRSLSPSAKRIKLELAQDSQSPREVERPGSSDLEIADNNEDAETNCSICLQNTVDRTVIPKCAHEFCFECILIWTEQSRRCPLCSQTIEEYLIHSIRSRYDYRKHYLPPLRRSPPPSRPAQSNATLQRTRHYARRRRQEREWGRRDRDNEENDKLERSIARRRWIYQHDLYAKHVASNTFTKYRPYPTPAQFTASQDLISRTTTFLRRELQVWEGLDVEFLTTFVISLMKSIDIRSESAVKLIAEFLDMDAPYVPGARHVNAEHFAHEVYSYVRSPYKDLFVYDTVVQYDTVTNVSPPPENERGRRWRQSSPPREHTPEPLVRDTRRQQHARSPMSERSTSWSPSGRRYAQAPCVESSNGSRNRRSRESPRRRESLKDNWIRHNQSSQNTSMGDNNNLDKPLGPARPRGLSLSQASEKLPSNDTEDASPTPHVELDIKEQGAYDIGMTKSISDLLASDSEFRILDPEAGKSDLDNHPTGGTENVQSPDKQGPSLSKVTRAPRNRTLRESVKAHLSGSSGAHGVDPRTAAQGEDPISLPAALIDSSTPMPSLLMRLSDPHHASSDNTTTGEFQALNPFCRKLGTNGDDGDLQTSSSSTLIHQDPTHSLKPLASNAKQVSRKFSNFQDKRQVSADNVDAQSAYGGRPSTSSAVDLVGELTRGSLPLPPRLGRERLATMAPPASPLLTTTVAPISRNQISDHGIPHACSSPCPSVTNCSTETSSHIKPAPIVQRSDPSTHATSVDLIEPRTRLLSRLGEGRARAWNTSDLVNDVAPNQTLASSVPPSSEVSGGHDAGDPPSFESHGPAQGDPHPSRVLHGEAKMREAQLRTRAILRSRLRAEKQQLIDKHQ